MQSAIQWNAMQYSYIFQVVILVRESIAYLFFFNINSRIVESFINEFNKTSFLASLHEENT